jgi:S1-C subfamily serine protease
MDWVDTNGPADLFGIKVGDIITEFDGVPIRTAAELLSRVRRSTPYKIVTVVVIRNGQRMEIPVKMGKDD